MSGQLGIALENAANSGKYIGGVRGSVELKSINSVGGLNSNINALNQVVKMAHNKQGSVEVIQQVKVTGYPQRMR
jgi:hypothetical protein